MCFALNDLAQLILGGVTCGQLDAYPNRKWSGTDGVVDSENAAEIGFAFHRDRQLGELNAGFRLVALCSLEASGLSE